MIRKWLSIAVLVATATVILSLSSCGRDQQLVSIQVQPATETFGDSNTPVIADAGLQVQLRALGTYIHPPVTKDITNQVTWASNTPQMMTVDSSGLLTATGQSCGGSLVSATVTTNTSAGGISSSGAVVTGFMTGNVTCFTGTGGGGGGAAPILSLAFSGNGTGTVTSNPSGLGCASVCSAQFASGTTVTLTATPTGASTFGSWSNCDTAPSVNPCSVTVTGNRTVTVTFN
jgi:Divergent InlB B-repeat domain